MIGLDARADLLDWDTLKLETWLSISRPSWPRTMLGRYSPTLLAAQQFVGSIDCPAPVEVLAGRVLVGGDRLQIIVDQTQAGGGPRAVENPVASHLYSGTVFGRAIILANDARVSLDAAGVWTLGPAR